MYALENENLRIEVSAKGAELQSIYDKTSGYEWLWQGDPKWWGKRAPILFPFIGCLKNGSYEYEGVTYNMTKHGFARDLKFECQRATEDVLEFSLKSNETTKAIYPFDFELKVIYTLIGKCARVIYQLTNAGEGKMWFSLGGHPAFNCPMEEEEWVLTFEKEEQLESYVIDLASGLIENQKKQVVLSQGHLKLNQALFTEDALVFEKLNSKSVILHNQKGTRAMSFNFSGFPLLALWSPPGPFICLEPWFGLADFTTHNGKLDEKQGSQTLGAGEYFECAHEITVIC